MELNDPMLLSAFGIFAIAAIVLVWLFNRGKRRKANRDTISRSRRTFDQAKEDYESAKQKLRQSDDIFVIDFVHDITDRQSLTQDEHRYIEYEQAFSILRDLRDVASPIAIVLHTFGGYSIASEMIASALKEHKQKTIAYVPYIALSGGTVIALAAQTIKMGKNAALGPIDTQYYGFSGSLFDKLLNTKSPDSIEDDAFLIASEALLDWQKSIERAVALVNETHKRQGDQKVRELASGKMSHAQRILPRAAKEFGFQIVEECPKEVYDLVDAKLQMQKMEGREAKRIEREQYATQRSVWSFVLNRLRY